MLLEAFIAILIFSMGILAIVGMQASAVKTSADAKYRSEASLLANELIGQMWVSNRTRRCKPIFKAAAARPTPTPPGTPASMTPMRDPQVCRDLPSIRRR